MFRVLEQETKDSLTLEVLGKDLNGLFTNAAKGIEALIVDPLSVKKEMVRKFNTQADDINELLFKFLSDLISLKDTYQLVFGSFQIEVSEGERSLFGSAKGEVIDRKRHKLKVNIKGLKRQPLVVKQEGNLWKARVVL